MEPTGNPPRLTVFCHIHNEAFLLPFWIRHHRRIFDHGVIVDRGSTDDSIQIIRELAPTWDVIPSRNMTFDAVDCDREMMNIEARYDGWKLVLNVTEYLFHADLDSYVQTLEQTEPETVAVRIQMVTMIDPPELSTTPVDPDVDLWRQRHHGRMPADDGSAMGRFFHKSRDGQYGFGRHTTRLPHRVAEDVLILRYSWSPFAAIRARKLSVQSATAATDITRGMGFHHLCTAEQLEAQYAVQSRVTYDLCEREPYRSIYLDMIAQDEESAREPASTRTTVPSELLSPASVVVLGTSGRCAEWVEALDAIPAETLDEAPLASAVVVSSQDMCTAYFLVGRSGPIIVDLCEPPDPRTLTAAPLFSPYRKPDSLVGVLEPLAAADYIVFSSDSMHAAWMPLLIKAGRVAEYAGLDVMATIPQPLASGAIDPVRAFLSNPVRRGVPVYADRVLQVSEASFQLTYNLMLRSLDDYYQTWTALCQQTETVVALQQHSAALAQQNAVLVQQLANVPDVRTTGTRRFRFPLGRRNQV